MLIRVYLSNGDISERQDVTLLKGLSFFTTWVRRNYGPEVSITRAEVVKGE